MLEDGVRAGAEPHAREEQCRMTQGTGRASALRASARRWSYSLSTLLPVFGGVAVTPALTRWLGVAEYGFVATASLLVQNVGLLLALGLGAQIHMVRVREGIAAARYVYRQGVAAAAGVGACLVLITTVVLPGSGFGVMVPLALYGSAVAAICGNGLVLLRAEDEPARYAITSLILSVAAPANALAVLYLSGQWTLYLAALYAGTSAAAVFVWICLRGEVSPAAGGLGRSLRLGLPTIPHQLGLYALPLALVAVAGVMSGPEASAHVQLGLFVGSMASLVVAALNATWSPTVMSAPETSRSQVADDMAARIFGVVAMVIAGVSLGAPLLVGYLTPTDFDRSSIVRTAVVASVAAFPAGVYYANSHLVLAAGATRSLALATPSLSVAATAVGALLWRRADVPLSVGLLLANSLIAAWFHRTASKAVGRGVAVTSYAPAGAVVTVTAACAWMLAGVSPGWGLCAAAAVCGGLAAALLTKMLRRPGRSAAAPR